EPRHHRPQYRLAQPACPVEDVGNGDENENADLAGNPPPTDRGIEPAMYRTGHDAGDVIEYDHHHQRRNDGAPSSPYIGGAGADGCDDGLNDAPTVYQVHTPTPFHTQHSPPAPGHKNGRPKAASVAL